MYDDELSWRSTPVDDLWVFDKLILSKKLGYKCGPVGVEVPKPDEYVVRPVTNLLGMARSAEIVYIENTTDFLGDGLFWCERFRGRHLTVDYIGGEQVLCAEGFHDTEDAPLYRFSHWVKTMDKIPYPTIMKSLTKQYQYVNIELIGDKIIEVHFRLNSDFSYNNSEVLVVWDDQEIIPPDGYKFVKSEDYLRKGFYIKDE